MAERESFIDFKIDSATSETRKHADESCVETYTSCRWILAYMGCVCLTISTGLKTDLGLAIVCMVKPSNSSTFIEHSAESECYQSINESILTVNDTGMNGEIEWSNSLQGAVLSSVFYGYIITQIPGAYLAERFSAKFVILCGLCLHGIATILIPFAARFDGTDYVTSAYLVMSLRILIGLSSGLVLPSFHSLWGKWAPPLERSKLVVLSTTGYIFGPMLILAVGGFFCEWKSFDGGWPSMFYVGGSVCLLFCPLWCVIVYDSPAKHPRISAKEKEYILSSLENRHASTGNNVAVPWRSIFTSPAVWAIIVAHTCSNFGGYTLLTKLPAFMNEVLGFNIKQNGIYSALPHLSMFTVANVVAQCTDRLRKRNVVSTVMCRKITLSIAFIVPAGIIIGVGYLSCGMQLLGVILLMLATAFLGFEISGWSVNHVDIAPRYAGVLMGISNTVATLPGIVAPLLINAMTPTGSATEWRNVFYVWASINLFGTLFYIIFARGSVQDWATDTLEDATAKLDSET